MKGFLWSALLVGFILDTGNTKCVDNLPNCKYLNDTFATCSNDQTAQDCSLFCGLCKIDPGVWSDWTTWNSCSVSCDAGLSTRVRTCSNPKPEGFGDHCFGNAMESRICMQRPCANGGWSTWSSWGDCREGMLVRNRTCNNPEPSLFGKQCEGNNMQTKSCRNQDGEWSPWSSWGDCRDGMLIRNRTCNNPEPSMFGKQCEGNDMQTKRCLNQVHGGWGDWSVLGLCSSTCGIGLRRRDRVCDSPRPSEDGNPCFGDNINYEICAEANCPVGWSSWADWGTCTVTCGPGGVRERSRSCQNPAVSILLGNCTGRDHELDKCAGPTCQGDVVYFNAHFYAMHETRYLTCPATVANVGNGYHGNNGSFVAPIDGLYLFSAQICTYSGNSIDVELRHVPSSGSERRIAVNTEYVPSGHSGCATTTAPVVLKSGEQVRVYTDKTSTGYIFEMPNTWNSFSGVLIEKIYN